MKKLLALALFCPALAGAANWVKVGPVAGGESYIDKNSTVKADNGYKVWSLVSYAKEQATPEGKPYVSVKALHLYSCTERTTTLLMQVFYAEAMGKGETTQSLKFEKFSPDDIVPDSVQDGVLQAVCHGKKK
ncbi:MAG: surface-adhesin E family protein [Pseudomonadota bacterium]